MLVAHKIAVAHHLFSATVSAVLRLSVFEPGNFIALVEQLHLSLFDPDESNTALVDCDELASVPSICTALCKVRRIARAVGMFTSPHPLCPCASVKAFLPRTHAPIRNRATSRLVVSRA